MAFFRQAPRQRCPALTSGPNHTKLGFLCFCRPFNLNRALETGRHHYWQIGTVLADFGVFLAFFWKQEDIIISRLARFFVGFSAGSKTTLPFACPWSEWYQTRFFGLLRAIPPEEGVGSGKIPVLADYPNFARFFRQAPRQRCLALTS